MRDEIKNKIKWWRMKLKKNQENNKIQKKQLKKWGSNRIK
jgi:hypothetical protein